MFQLHPQLEADTINVGNFLLCRLLLMNDANYPWFILVPQRPDITEIHQLSVEDRTLLIEESCHLARAMESVFAPDKLNIAALGNVVPQLHLHHIARYHGDPAWPGPVWGVAPRVCYDETALRQRLEQIVSALAGGSFTPSP